MTSLASRYTLSAVMSRKEQSKLGGIVCKRCGQEIHSGLVFLCGSRSWIPFCNRCMYHSNRTALAIAATGMSEEELAENMELSANTIRAWKNGTVKRPKPGNLERLAALAGVSESWLAGHDKDPGRNTQEDPARANAPAKKTKSRSRR